MEIHRINSKLLGGAACGLLALAVVALCCPMSGQVQAEGESNPSMATVMNAVDVKPMIALSLDSSTKMEVVPTSTGGTNRSVANLAVTTNSANGFRVMMNSVNGTDLKAADKNNTAVIGSTTKTATLADLDANTWGYYLGNSDPETSAEYQPVPSDSTEIAATEMSGSVTNYKLAFGTKVDPKIPAGTYTGSVVVSAIANPITVTSLLQLTYMQEMTSEICENTLDASDNAGFKQNPITKRLIDTRDGNAYWVAKLADGKCWMTQNLDFDIKVKEDGTSNVKAMDTDVEQDWNMYPPTGYHGWKEEWNELAKAAFNTASDSAERAALTTALGDSGWKFLSHFSNDKTRQYDYFTYTYTEAGEEKTGTYYPPETTLTELPVREQNSVAAWLRRYSFDFGKYMSGFLPVDETYACTSSTMEGCASKGIINVGNEAEWTPNFTAQEGSYTLPDGSTFEGTILANQTNYTYDAHYLFGNYYSYGMASVATGLPKGTSTSVCPKGWRLPEESTTRQDFRDLLSQYGSIKESGGLYNATVNVQQAPFYFPLAGFTWADQMAESNNGIWYLNRAGRYYSASASSQQRVVSLQTLAYDSDLVTVTAAGDDVNYYPHTIRCIAR